MSISVALAAMFGKPVSKKLIDTLLTRPNGTQRLAQASAAMAKGIGAIEALKGAFGSDFLKTLNDVLGSPANGKFSYEAGVSSYIKADADPTTSPFAVLRDELNLNLDRISLTDMGKATLKNQFRGALHVWKSRFQELAPEYYNDDAKAILSAMDQLLDDTNKTFKDVYRLLSATGIGVIGTLLLISGVFLATGTGVGIVTAISVFLFGIPWLHVGALVLPGALMLALAAMHLRDDQAMSACVQLAYKLIERGMAAQATHPPTTQREQ